MAKAGKKILVAIADDHSLMRNALGKLINSFGDYTVLFEANNGKEIRPLIHQHGIPDIMLVDVNMPEMDGFETTKWLHSNYPQIKVLVLSMLSDERTIIRMMRLGAKGYLLKNAEPEELKEGLDSVISKDVYLPDIISGKLISGLHRDADKDEDAVVLNEREREFLRWVCTELAYREIAEKMNLSARTIDDYRQNLFTKLKVHSRIGLALYAIRNGIAEV
jgi:two-component system, NarL family, invasion response regulator UvrY